MPPGRQPRRQRADNLRAPAVEDETRHLCEQNGCGPAPRRARSRTNGSNQAGRLPALPLDVAHHYHFPLTEIYFSRAPARSLACSSSSSLFALPATLRPVAIGRIGWGRVSSLSGGRRGARGREVCEAPGQTTGIEQTGAKLVSVGKVAKGARRPLARATRRQLSGGQVACMSGRLRGQAAKLAYCSSATARARLVESLGVAELELGNSLACAPVRLPARSDSTRLDLAKLMASLSLARAYSASVRSAARLGRPNEQSGERGEILTGTECRATGAE